MSDLQKYDSAQIAQITDIKEAVHIKNMADAAALFYKAQDAWADAQKAQEYRLRAIRAAGTILLPPAQGGNTPRVAGTRGELTTPYQQALEDAGVDERHTAVLWQKVARVPDDKFEAYFVEAEYWMDDFSIAGLMRFAGEWFGRSDIGEWGTPPELFAELDKEFHFELDVCALPSNAKCEIYFTPDDNGLKQEWNGICWMNPPYGREIGKWMAKAKLSADEGATVVCLVPARTDTEWWWENCIGGEIRFIKGRLTFEGANSGAPFPSAVVVLEKKVKPRVLWWGK